MNWQRNSNYCTNSGHPGSQNNFKDGELRITYVFKRSCQGFCALAIWFERRLQPRILKSPKCAAATRPGRTEIGESGILRFSGRLAESAKTRGASFSEPAALKVQLYAVAPGYSTILIWMFRGWFHRLELRACIQQGHRIDRQYWGYWVALPLKK